MLEVIKNDSKIVSTSMVDASGEEPSSKSITDRPDSLIVYINGIAAKPIDFVNDDLIYLIGVILPNLDLGILKDTLVYMSKEYYSKKHKIELTTEIIHHSITYLHSKNINNDYNNRVMEVLKSLKGYWSASGVKDKTVKEIKKILYNEVKLATNKKTKWLLTTGSIGVILYTFLRAIAR